MTPNRLIGLSLALSILSLPAAAQRGKEVRGVYEDPVAGFRIKVPSKWKLQPNKPEESWIAVKYLCNRQYTNKGGGFVTAHTPELRVLTFSKEKIKKEKSKTFRGRVFRDYHDYVPQFWKGLGLGGFETERKDEKLGDLPVTEVHYEVKGQNGYLKLHQLAWIIERPGEDSTVAVEFTVLEDRYRNLHKDIYKSLQSFKFIDKVVDAAADVNLERPLWMHDSAAWSRLSQAERWEYRRRTQEARRQKYVNSAPDGWFTMESKKGHYLALSHTDKDYTNHVLKSAEAMRSWLDKNLGEISDEFVMTGVIRICSGFDEYRSYRTDSSAAGASSFSLDDREIVDYKDVNSGSRGGGLGIVAAGLLDNYLYDKDSDIYGYLPGWLGVSLRMYFRDAELKGSKLRMRASTGESVLVKEARREDDIRTFQEIVTTPRSSWPDERRSQARFVMQSNQVVRFLIDGPGKKHKLLKNLIPRYMIATSKAAEEWRASRTSEGAADSVEAEEARARERAKYWEKRYKFILEKVNEECLNFSDKEWEQVNKLFAKYLSKV